MSAQQEMIRNMGWLVYGVVLGALLGLCIDIWASIFLKWLEATFGITDWVPYLLFTTLLLVVGIGFLIWYALKSFPNNFIS